MALAIFSTQRGIAHVINDNSALLVIRPADWPGTASTALITEMQSDTEAAVQFYPTLNDFAYVYVFGDMISNLVLRGHFFADCTHVSGLSNVWNYYLSHRISATGQYCTLTVGWYVALGFLVKCDINVVDSASRLGQFTLYFKTIPY